MNYITLKFKVKNAYHFSQFTIIRGKDVENRQVLSFILYDRRVETLWQRGMLGRWSYRAAIK